MSDRPKGARGRATAVYDYEGAHEDFDRERSSLRLPSRGPTDEQLSERLVDPVARARAVWREKLELRIMCSPGGSAFLARWRRAGRPRPLR